MACDELTPEIAKQLWGREGGTRRDIQLMGGAGNNYYGCHTSDTLVLMSDLTFKKHKDIRVGDTLKSDKEDVSVISANNKEALVYEVEISNGDILWVTADHIFPVINKQGIKEDKLLFDISPTDKVILQEYEGKVKPKIDPYYIGVWLGDGGSERPNRITSVDKEIIDYLKSVSYKYRLGLTKVRINYSLTHKIRSTKLNPITEIFRYYNLENNKHIPQEAFQWSREDKLKLLAGLLDTDGSFNKRQQCFVFYQSDPRLSMVKDIIKLCHSVGLNTSKIFTDNRHKNIGYQIRIEGDYSIIPTLVKRKQSTNINGKPYFFRLTGNKKLAEITVLQVSGNQRYVLSNGVLTHNCFQIRARGKNPEWEAWGGKPDEVGNASYERQLQVANVGWKKKSQAIGGGTCAEVYCAWNIGEGTVKAMKDNPEASPCTTQVPGTKVMAITYIKTQAWARSVGCDVTNAQMLKRCEDYFNLGKVDAIQGQTNPVTGNPDWVQPGIDSKDGKVGQVGQGVFGGIQRLLLKKQTLNPDEYEWTTIDNDTISDSFITPCCIAYAGDDLFIDKQGNMGKLLTDRDTALPYASIGQLTAYFIPISLSRRFE